MRWWALASVALALTSACRSVGAGRERPNVVFVVIDTLRADRVGSRDLTPFLDQLAADGWVFRHAYAPSSGTKPSVASLLTSRWVSQHGVWSWTARLAAAEVTFPELLHDAGWATAGFSANVAIAGGFGFEQGFDHYAVYPCDHAVEGSVRQFPRRVSEMATDVRSWVRERRAKDPSQPLFLYLQPMEMHFPYAPPAPAVAARLAVRPEYPERANASHLFGVDDEGAAVLRTVYDAEMLTLDDELRGFFDELRALGILDRAIVVVTADHGEALGERNAVGHGMSVYDELIHVPLIVALPGRRGHGTVDAPVSLVDLAPTVLDLLGLPAAHTFEGISLRGDLDDGHRDRAGGEPRTIYSELIREPAKVGHRHAVIRWPDKMIVSTDGTVEYYDLARDPGETTAASPSAATQAALGEALAQMTAKAHVATAAETAPVDDETRRGLKALGYVQ